MANITPIDLLIIQQCLETVAEQCNDQINDPDTSKFSKEAARAYKSHIERAQRNLPIPTPPIV